MTKSEFETSLTKVSNAYFPMIQRQLEGNSIEMDSYSKQCVMNSISAINETLDVAGVTWNDPQLDQSNVTEILLSIASLKLNPSASPNEVYFQLRNVKYQKRNKQGKLVDDWRKQIEMGIEGDGNDAILARFGRNVKQVMKFWEVRENDQFTYPSFNGLEMTSPTWTPTGKGKVIKVVYPIIKHGDIVEYYIAEREDVVKNLIAHVNNNLMRETFGIAKSTYEATPKQRSQINQKKQEILERIEELGLDSALEDELIQKHVSPAWKSPQSKESMIVRKMRNNVVKKIPKDFGNTLTELSYDKTSSDIFENRARKDVAENANSEIIDIVEEPEQEIIDIESEDKSENQQKESQQPTNNEDDKEQAKPEKQPKDQSEQEQGNMFDNLEDDVPF